MTDKTTTTDPNNNSNSNRQSTSAEISLQKPNIPKTAINFTQFRSIICSEVESMHAEVSKMCASFKQQISDRDALNLDVRHHLHWVLKVGNLKTSIEFFARVFGMRVLRHEEFSHGCKAQCNGDFQQPWSKTMLGYGSELTKFALELTYNYGIVKYRRGNDLKYIGLTVTRGGLDACRQLGYSTTALHESQYWQIIGPDDIPFRCKLVTNEPGERFWSIALNCRDVAATHRYWCGVLNMYPSSYVAGKYLRCGYGRQVAIEFFQLCGIPLDHATASGRIAFTTCVADGVFVLDRYIRTFKQYVVHTPPVTLKTAGKADVQVIILQDVDGYEICFVGEQGFRQLSTTKKSDEFIDWPKRAQMGGDKTKGKYVK